MSDDEGYLDEDPPGDLGPCCACGVSGPTVRNIAMLKKRAPVAGHGWGCLVCDLPLDGAVVVVCDDCHAVHAEFIWACRGWPGKDGRIPIGHLSDEPFDHDLSKHPESVAYVPPGEYDDDLDEDFYDDTYGGRDF